MIKVNLIHYGLLEHSPVLKCVTRHNKTELTYIKIVHFGFETCVNNKVRTYTIQTILMENVMQVNRF